MPTCPNCGSNDIAGYVRVKVEGDLRENGTLGYIYTGRVPEQVRATERAQAAKCRDCGWEAAGCLPGPFLDPDDVEARRARVERHGRRRR